MKDIKINKEPVELYKILKFEGIADSGGEAKAMIDAGLVMVNGQVEMRKRNKIVSGTIIEVGGHQFKIVFEP
ncbi:MAG: RNA-binding S4 domain-containing protein [Gammaproteobacteria bacterium]|nr:RNA-binding S4 domain-containing protein [Gammaproteobacteria bacterium]MDP2347824.1 RNA-binding S4 domain-containing protein [Gammaproteobacteria bacterium]